MLRGGARASMSFDQLCITCDRDNIQKTKTNQTPIKLKFSILHTALGRRSMLKILVLHAVPLKARPSDHKRETLRRNQRLREFRKTV